MLSSQVKILMGINMYYWQDFIKDINQTLKPGNLLLDAGAGDCYWKNHFSSDIKYIGMDIGAAENVYDYSLLDIKGDLRNIPLENASVDTIINIQVLEHLPEPWKVVAEFNRVLKQEGYLFVSCPQGAFQHQVPYDFFRYTPFGLRSLLESNGFEVIWIKPQLGNFNHIQSELRHSTLQLPKLTSNTLSKITLNIFSLYLRALFLLHKPIFRYLDKFEKLQDSPDGHFVMARKIKNLF